MALEPVPSYTDRTEWVCPMHPDVVRDAPGSCPICGIALEPRTVTAEEQENPELSDMHRRFAVSAALTVPLFIIAIELHAEGLRILMLTGDNRTTADAVAKELGLDEVGRGRDSPD